MVDPYELETPTLRDLVIYIDRQLGRTDEDTRIAYSIAGLYSLPTIDALRENSDLETVLSYAGSLEIPGDKAVKRARDWKELRDALDRLRAQVDL